MSSFKPSNFLQECIDKRDLNGIKNALYVALNADRYFSTGNFDDILNYAKERVPEFILPDKGETFKPESEWTEDYWSKLSVSLKNEFTMEKVRQLKKMSEKLYPPRTSSYQSTGGNSESPKISPIAIAIGAAVVIGIIIIAIAAGK